MGCLKTPSKELSDMIVDYEAQFRNVLVIDDDETVLTWFRSVIRKQSRLNLTVLQNELKVLEVIDQIRPELIFIDLNLNSISGERLGKIIQASSLFNVKIVYMSASKRNFEGKDQFTNNFMEKPLSRSVVESRIQKILKL